MASLRLLKALGVALLFVAMGLTLSFVLSNEAEAMGASVDTVFLAKNLPIVILAPIGGYLAMDVWRG
jgi:hypothetical protein